MTDQDHLERINALTRNARTIWFALLAALVFVGITLMSVEHIDFYGVDRATQLPLVNVAVPTRLFFVAAPILIAGIYCYFHLYLIRLWDALGAAPARLNGIRLGDAVTPWLVIDAALHFRHRMRRDNATTPRTLEGGAMLLNLLLAWRFGLIVLYLMWQQSMPARTFWMTGIVAGAFAVSLITGASSVAMLARRMRRAPEADPPVLWATGMQGLGLAIGGAALLWSSYQQTEGTIDLLAGLDLVAGSIVERPPGWLPYKIARSEFRADWCRREMEGRECDDFGDRESSFAEDFSTRRAVAIADMPRHDSIKVGRARAKLNAPDFRNADLSNSFLVGANLAYAQLDGAIVTETQMEGANLFRAKMNGAKLSRVQMENADLNGAQMEGVDLKGSQMEGTGLHFSQLIGTADSVNRLEGTNLRMSINDGGMLRFVDLSGAEFDAATDFRNVFLDASVTMTSAFREQMENPCQWAEGVLDDNEFYGRWRGWIEADPPYYWRSGWEYAGPDAYRNVTPIPPPPGCTWKTEPMTQARPD